MTSNPISTILGATIEGVSLSDQLSQIHFDFLSDALHKHGFIVLKEQDLTPNQLVSFANLWGQPSPHVIDTFHHPDDSNVLILSNVYKDGKPTGVIDGGTYFHTDYSYLEKPARCTILHAIDVPKTTNGTRFANQAAAYDDLPELMKKKIANLVVRHHYGNRDNLEKSSRTAAPVLTPDQAKKITWVEHPLVKKHPFSGQVTLYAVSGSSFGIKNMPNDEALDLLDELKVHSTQDKYCYTNDYENGDVIVWDNALLLHSAPLIDLTLPRTLWRVTVLYPH